jgi:hypothetical protein
MMPLLPESQPFNKGLSRDAIFTLVSTLDVLLAALQIYIYISLAETTCNLIQLILIW